MLDDGHILLVGWDGVSVCKAFHHYLKYVLNKDVDWFKVRIELPYNLQLPNVTIESTSASPIIYHQNVCTWSYSFAWWDFEQWRRHLDWMALMGISLTIAPVQEAIWVEVYTEMGLSSEEIDAHLAGPAFQAWQRMGNIRGWAGPLKPEWRRLQLLLQHCSPPPLSAHRAHLVLFLLGPHSSRDPQLRAEELSVSQSLGPR